MLSRPFRAGLLLAIPALLIGSAMSQTIQPNPKTPANPHEITLPPSAFPDLKPPLNEGGGTDLQKLRNLLLKRSPLPVPAEASALRKVQILQANEGFLYIKTTLEVLVIGNWDSSYYRNFVTAASDICLAAADAETSPAAQVPWYENRVILFKAFENYMRVRVLAGNEPSQNIYLASFYRLQAEADLLKLKDEVEKAGKK